MATSYIEYKGFGFWSRDSFIENWLLTLLAEMEKLPEAEHGQQALIEHWRLQASIDGGCMGIGLDDFLTDETRRQQVLSIARKVLPSAEPLGRQTGELFVKLLEGQLQTTASSPIDYLNWPDESGRP